jgi:hypothetical protein
MSIRVIRENNDNCDELLVVNDQGNVFRIHYAGGDLYWTMIDYVKDNEFVVGKEDFDFYKGLENIFSLLGDSISCFEWFSESYGEKENANKLFINKIDKGFCIKFFQNPNRDINRKDICSICFCLSGSRCQNIANEFSLMFHRLSSKCKNR